MEPTVVHRYRLTALGPSLVATFGPTKRAKRPPMTHDQIREIRALYATGQYTQDQLAQRFNAAQPTIGYIVRRDTYKNVT